MSNPQAEPSMEEILASIRRIISEDGEEADAPSAKAPAASPQPASIFRKPAPESAATESASPEPAAPAATEQEEGDDLLLKTEDVEMIKKNAAKAAQEHGEERMLADTTAAAASKAFQDLSQSVRVSRDDGPGKTLEDIVTEMLRPMIKEWLDANLPAIVEEKVEEEVQRVARRRR